MKTNLKFILGGLVLMQSTFHLVADSKAGAETVPPSVTVAADSRFSFLNVAGDSIHEGEVVNPLQPRCAGGTEPLPPRIQFPSNQ